jgi:hypothetical protein
MNPMDLQIIGIGLVLLMLAALFIFTVIGKFKPASASSGSAPATVGSGMKKAGGVFFWLGLAVGVAGFFLIGPMAVYAASGCFTLALVLWIVGTCLP